MSLLVEAREVLPQPEGSLLASRVQGIKPGELEAEGILHRWHANPTSVSAAIKDLAFEVVHGKSG